MEDTPGSPASLLGPAALKLLPIVGAATPLTAEFLQAYYTFVATPEDDNSRDVLLSSVEVTLLPLIKAVLKVAAHPQSLEAFRDFEAACSTA